MYAFSCRSRGFTNGVANSRKRLMCAFQGRQQACLTQLCWGIAINFAFNLGKVSRSRNVPRARNKWLAHHFSRWFCFPHREAIYKKRCLAIRLGSHGVMGLLTRGRSRVISGASCDDVYGRSIGTPGFASRLFSQRAWSSRARIAGMAAERSFGSVLSTDFCFGARHRDIRLASARKDGGGWFLEADARHTIPAGLRAVASQCLRVPVLE